MSPPSKRRWPLDHGASHTAIRSRPLDVETLLLCGRVIALVIGSNDKIVRTIRVDFDGPELASRNLVLEQDVEFGISETLLMILAQMLNLRLETETYLWLWQTEVCPNQSKQVESTPEEAGLPAPAPSSRIHHSRL